MSFKIWILVAAASLCGACASNARGMQPTTTPTYVSSEMATVVFVRHTRFGGAINFVVVDQDNAFITGLRGSGHGIAMLPPGQYSFYTLAENTEMVKATLEPDRIYVIEARVRPGAWKARVTTEVVHRDSTRFDEALSWIRETPSLVPSPDSSGQAWVDGRQDEVAKRIAQIEGVWPTKDELWREQRTLHPEDGYEPGEFSVGK